MNKAEKILDLVEQVRGLSGIGEILVDLANEDGDEIVVVLKVDWEDEEDDDSVGFHGSGRTATEITISETFKWNGKTYRSGKEFPVELMIDIVDLSRDEMKFLKIKDMENVPKSKIKDVFHQLIQYRLQSI